MTIEELETIIQEYRKMYAEAKDRTEQDTILLQVRPYTILLEKKKNKSMHEKAKEIFQ